MLRITNSTTSVGTDTQQDDYPINGGTAWHISSRSLRSAWTRDASSLSGTTAPARASPLVSEPEDIRVFNGAITRGSIGDMTLAEVYSGRATDRAPFALACGAHQGLHVLPASAAGGRKRFQPPGRMRRCSAKVGLHPLRQHAPLRNDLTRRKPHASCRHTPHTLRRQIGCPECLSQYRCPADAARAAFCRNCWRKYWSEYHQDLDELTGGRIAVAILDLDRGSYATHAEGAGRSLLAGTANRIRIINYIQAHLNDPDRRRHASQKPASDRPISASPVLNQDEPWRATSCVAGSRRAAALQSDAQRGRTVTAIAFRLWNQQPDAPRAVSAPSRSTDAARVSTRKSRCRLS